MKIEVIVKLVLDLKEFEGSLADFGLNDMLDDEYVQLHYEVDEMSFQSEADEDIVCKQLEGEILSVKKL